MNTNIGPQGPPKESPRTPKDRLKDLKGPLRTPQAPSSIRQTLPWTRFNWISGDARCNESVGVLDLAGSLDVLNLNGFLGMLD